MENKKRILFLIPTLMNGGAERVLVNLVNNMDFNKYDISVKCVMNTGRYQKSLDKRIHYSYIFSSIRRGCSWIFKLFTPSQAFNRYIGDTYDIIVSYLEGFTSRIISGCSNPNVKKIAWIHIEMLNKKVFAENFRTYREAQRCYQAFDKIICVSETVKQHFEAISGITDKTIVLYNTNDTADIKYRKNEHVDDLVLDINEINIFSVAKIVPSKGYDRLARIQKRLKDDSIKTHVYIIGTGSAQNEIETYIKQEKIDNVFTFLGYRENPYKYLAMGDLYVCSSRREGFSTAVTEALIIGLPVVSTRCAGAEELLGHNNEYGIVTDNDEESLYKGIKEMVTIEENLKKYRLLASQRGAFFSTEKTVQAVEEMLDNL